MFFYNFNKKIIFIFILFRNSNNLHCELKTDYIVEGLYGGPLLCAKSQDFVVFYDWETAKVVRRIKVRKISRIFIKIIHN